MEDLAKGIYKAFGEPSEVVVATPLPPHEEMVIADLTEEEAAAFFDAVNS